MRSRNVAVASARVEAEHRRRARGRLAVPLEDLDGRRLAGAVLAEQAVDLPGVDLERDAVDGSVPSRSA